MFSGQPTVVVSKNDVWHTGQVTTYAAKFEGRRCADGSRFSHKRLIVACRGGSFGRRIELRYGKNGRAIVKIADRGRLPMHRSNKWQFDTTKAVAKKLGLYRIHRGKTDRTVKWRYIE
jgi:rare lipoprotein A